MPFKSSNNKNKESCNWCFAYGCMYVFICIYNLMLIK